MAASPGRKGLRAENPAQTRKATLGSPFLQSMMIS